MIKPNITGKVFEEADGKYGWVVTVTFPDGDQLQKRTTKRHDTIDEAGTEMKRCLDESLAVAAKHGITAKNQVKLQVVK